MWKLYKDTEMKKIHLIDIEKGSRMYVTYCGEWYIHKDKEKYFTDNMELVDCGNCLRVMNAKKHE